MDLRPTPVITSEVCSVCGLDWARHGDKPTAKTCIDLLRIDLASARVAQANRPFVQPIPYLPYTPVPWAQPYRPYWGTLGGMTGYATATTVSTNGTAQVSLGGQHGISSTASTTI